MLQLRDSLFHLTVTFSLPSNVKLDPAVGVKRNRDRQGVTHKRGQRWRAPRDPEWMPPAGLHKGVPASGRGIKTPGARGQSPRPAIAARSPRQTGTNYRAECGLVQQSR